MQRFSSILIGGFLLVALITASADGVKGTAAEESFRQEGV